MASDEYYISVALKEAAKGLGRTSPNPCVGAVIVREGRIVATGYHKQAGMLRSAGRGVPPVEPAIYKIYHYRPAMDNYEGRGQS